MCCFNSVSVSGVISRSQPYFEKYLTPLERLFIFLFYCTGQFACVLFCSVPL